MSTVTTIKIIGFKGERLEIDFVRFLLKDARMLQKMIIQTNQANYGTGGKNFKQKELLLLATALLSFPRSSSNAIILFS